MPGRGQQHVSKMNAVGVFIGFCLIMASGCLGAPEGDEGAEPAGIDSAGPEQLPLALFFSECQGEISTSYLPAALNDPPVPAGYEYDTEVNGFYLKAFECSRVGVGEFERGPIRIIMEGHTNYVPPSECARGDFDRANVLANFWINDQELAVYLLNLGLPATFAEITLEEIPDGGPRTWIWSGGGSESRLSVSNNHVDSGTTDFTTRLYWFINDSIAFLDFNYSGPYDLTTPAWGLISPPAAFAVAGPTSWHGLANTLATMDITGEFSWFGDLDCEQPRS